MSFDINQFVAGPLYHIQLALIAINTILHFIFAAAVAKDAGRLEKQGYQPFLVSGVTWAFATLLGGILTAGLYWLIHHSSFSRVK